MTQWDYKILTKVLGTEVVDAPAEGLMRFSGLSIDSRTIKPGDVFFAIVGDKNDGHDYITDAFTKGAAVAVVNESHLSRVKQHAGGPLFIVDNTHEALLEIAAYIRRHIDASFAGVTGSNGKSTTKEMLYSIASVSHKTFRSPGNLNNLFGLPISLGMMPDDAEYAVFELGISVPGEMSRLASVIKPELAIITNIGPAHLETLGSIENVVKAKFELIDNLPVGAIVILNADDEKLMREAKRRALDFIGFGIENATHFTGKDIAMDGEGCQVFFVNNQEIRLNSVGLVNVYNALAAIAASSVWGCPPSEWASGIAAFTPLDLRLTREHFNGLELLIDCYNANPSSVKASLATLERMSAQGRKIAVLGDMLELGAKSDELHRQIGVEAAHSGIDYLFCFGPLSDVTAEAAVEAGMTWDRVSHSMTMQELLDALLKYIARGDLILFKASRGMELEKAVHGVKASAFKNN